MNKDLFRQAQQRLQASQRILVVSHIRPDGDAIGSLLGLGLSLIEMGKDVQMVLADGLPASFRFLNGSELVHKKPSGKFDLTCVVDCSDLARVGKEILTEKPDINFDHHATNLNFAVLNLVDATMVSTTELIADFLVYQGWRISQPVASSLLTGLITDTIGFRTSNISPKAMRLAADLMEAGADQFSIYQQALENKSFEALHLWSAGLGRLEREDGLIWTSLTANDRKTAKYPGKDDADLINILSSTEGMDIALIFVDQPRGMVKVSWRSRPDYDVANLALQFGGGGHPRAAGAEIPGNIDAVRKQVLDATREYYMSAAKRSDR